jgi:excisionase family DNA binding protein
VILYLRKEGVMSEGYLTAKEVAMYLKLHPDTVCELCKKGEFDAVKVGGITSKWLIKRGPFEAKFGKVS